jgi:hypothetical protein
VTVRSGGPDDLIGVATLRRRGWAPVMIRDLLGEADRTRPNPPGRAAAPVRLWSAKRVTEVEASPEFAARRAGSKRRAAAPTAAAGRKPGDLLPGRIRAVPVTVPRMSRGDVIRRSCEHHNQRAAVRDDPMASASPGDDPEFLGRITVSYLRHEVTGYEAELAGLSGRIGRAEAAKLIRACVLDAIAEAYPWLADECRHQKRRDRHTLW